MSVELPLNPCVLVVDDDPTIVRALEKTLGSAGYLVVATGDPLVALEHLRQRPASVIIADQQMDSMTGLELLAHARTLQPHCSRILITGMLSMKKFTDEIGCGEIYRFFAKPWSTPELLNTIHNAVEHYRLHCENAALQAETRRLLEDLRAEKETAEGRVVQLSTDKDELEGILAGLRASRTQLFKFCEAVLEAFDGALAARTRRTVEICGLLAEATGRPVEFRENLMACAWFHDLGLVGVSRLADTQPEQDVAGATFRDHPAISERLALSAGLDPAVASAIRAHHESFDGAGFPDQLRGRQIPELARCLTPVAYFVSCGLNRQQAIAELEKLAGVAFDPNVVPHVLRLVLQLSFQEGRKPAAAAAMGNYGATGKALSIPGNLLRNDGRVRA